MKTVNLHKAAEFRKKTGIPPATMKRWVKAGKITCYKIPGKKICYYDPKQVL